MSPLCSMWALTFSRSRIDILKSLGVESNGSHQTSSDARTEQEHRVEDVSFPEAFLWYLSLIYCRRASNLLSCLGEVTGTGRELLVTGRFTMISKGSSNGLRPICIGCCAYRAIGAISVIAARARLPSMQPLHFGGGIRNGAEIVARVDTLAYDQGKTILSIDINNAFNTTRHSIIHDGLLQADPSLLHYCRWTYGNPFTLLEWLWPSPRCCCVGWTGSHTSIGSNGGGMDQLVVVRRGWWKGALCWMRPLCQWRGLFSLGLG